MGLFTSLKVWLMIVMLVGGLGTAGYYVHRYKNMELEITAIEGKKALVEKDLTNCIDTSSSLGIKLGMQNKRIEAYNAARLKEVEESKAWIDVLTRIIYKQDENNQELREALSKIALETQEVIEDDEEFAKWAADDTPPVGWRLLRESTKDHTR